MAFATDPHVVADQAGAVACAWSPAGAPLSWRLTAAQFETLRDDTELLNIAATIPAGKLPPLLFAAAATFLVLELRPEPLASWFPRVGEPQPPLGAGFPAEYRQFCLDHRDRLLELCSQHRYQMNEVGRCADVIPALTPLVPDGRDLVLVDVGTGAGLGLHLDRYHYLYRGPGGRRASVGDPGCALSIEVEVRGEHAPDLPSALPVIVDRVGIDTEPLDPSEPAVRAWLAACVPQEIAAVTRFQRAAEIAASHPARTVRGDACDVLPGILAGCDPGALVCVVDSYVDVFFSPSELLRFRALMDSAGAGRTWTGSRSTRSCPWAGTPRTACPAFRRAARPAAASHIRGPGPGRAEPGIQQDLTTDGHAFSRPARQPSGQRRRSSRRSRTDHRRRLRLTAP